MVRIRDETGDSSKDSERFDLEMCCRRRDETFVEGDVRVILLVNIQILDKTLTQEVVESDLLLLQHLEIISPKACVMYGPTYNNVISCDLWPLVLDNYHRSADTASIASNVYCMVVVIDVYANELAESTRSSESSKVCHEASWEASQADDGSIDVHDEGVVAVNFCSCCKANV